MPAGSQIQPVHSIDDDTLGSTDLTTCTLLVLTSGGQFKYAVLDPKGNKFIALKVYKAAPGHSSRPELDLIEHCFDADKLLYTAFQHTRIAFNKNPNVLVPSSLFHETDKKDLLYLLHGEGLDEEVVSDSVMGLDLMNVYPVNRLVLGFLKKEFPGASFCHAVTPLLHLLPAEAGSQGSALFLIMQKTWFHLIAFSEGKLVLQQQTRFTQPSDVVYHVLNGLGQLGIPPQECRVSLSGDSSDNAPVFDALGDYIQVVRWLDRPSGYQFIDKFSSYPSSYFYHLFSVATCGL